MTDTTATPRISMTEIGSAIAKLRQMQEQLPPGERAVVEELLRAARVAETTPPQYNPYLPGAHTSPYSFYERLQAENPIHWSETVQAWILTRHADVAAAFHDRRLSSRGNYEALLQKVPEPERQGVQTVTRFITATLNQLDPPEHTRVRRVITRALSAAMVGRRRPFIEQVVDELLDGVQSRGEFDLVADFAEPLPPRIGAHLLGVPDGDWPAVATLITHVMKTYSDGFSGSEAMTNGEQAVPQLIAYFLPLVAARRAEPRDDAISAMLAGDDADDGEIVTLCIQFLMGIQETIRHTITVGVHALLHAPDQWALLRADPSLIASAIEELVRFDVISPVVQRTATEDIEIDGHTIRAGQQVVLLLAAANRDPAKFDCPAELDVSRRPNPHLGFGSGIHACPGAALGRAASTVALAALLQRFPDLRFAPEAARWREEGNVRGLVSLPLRFTPITASGDRHD